MAELSYKLASELNDAGFPQGGTGSWVGDPDAVVMRGGDRFYAPTLSELIDACGELRDFSLQHSLARGVGNDTWHATLQQRDDPATMLGAHGSSPEEAVARLWLALADEEQEP